MMTNLSAPNLLLPPNTTLATFQILENQVKAPRAICPQSRPYSIFGMNCVACNTPGASYFDLGSQKCVGCPSGLYYASMFRNCTAAINITNTNSLINYFGKGNYSLANVTKQLNALSKGRKTITCPFSSPLAVSNGSCIPCFGKYFVDLKNMKCVKGVTISNFPILKISKVIQLGKSTLKNL